ncbi:cell division protein FtsQ/DivIB [Secundilactobacillus kimchicus]|uniref:cell division protein FtsQ/DivIB n=1 Tax=Secundilactobacillus kimchicus TaxID=528209 RepID=UPI0024A80D82|nr:cell division protein FtsQ/DivIB [Secundilactobacillus kimchicus]
MAFKSKKTTSNSELTPWEKYQQAQKQHAAAKKHRPKLRIGKKLPKLKQQKERQLSRRMGILIGSFGVVLLIAVYFVSPLSHISAIQVVGNRELTSRQVENVAAVHRGDSIFRVVGKKDQLTASAEKKEPRVRQLSFDISNFNHLKIRVKEYPTAGYVASKGQYQVVLESGVISKETRQQPSGNYPVYDKFNSQQTLHKMIVQFSQLPDDLKGGISEIQYLPTKSNLERIHAFMNDGNEVYASLSTFAKKMAYYPSIAEKMKTKGVVNLEVGAYSYPFNS